MQASLPCSPRKFVLLRTGFPLRYTEEGPDRLRLLHVQLPYMPILAAPRSKGKLVQKVEGLEKRMDNFADEVASLVPQKESNVQGKEFWSMNGTQLIRARRSIRRYQKGVVIPREEIQLMLEAAMMAPSAVNTRPWEFVVVETDSVKEQLMEAHPYAKMLRTASIAIVVCGRPDLQEGVCNSYWPQDCGAAIENLLLQATELGYGSCWCGCYPAMERVQKIQKILGIGSVPVAIVAVGKGEEAPAAKGFFDPQRVTYR